MEDIIFEDRRDAGQRLAAVFLKQAYQNQPIVVFGIPRGGVIVADEVAKALFAPLDVIIARKIRAPYQTELGIGAVVDGDPIPILNEELVHAVGATRDYLDQEVAIQRQEIERRLQSYRRGQSAPEISGKIAIVIDDGIATGYTFRAALEGLRRRNPKKLVGAAPVAARESAEMLQPFADELICLSKPFSFFAVGTWYRNFDQTSDEEVASVLRRNWAQFEAQQPTG